MRFDYSINYKLIIQEELFSARQEGLQYSTYSLYHACPFKVCLICTLSALGPAALGLWVYTSGKPLVPMI